MTNTDQIIRRKYTKDKGFCSLFYILLKTDGSDYASKTIKNVWMYYLAFSPIEPGMIVCGGEKGAEIFNIRQPSKY